MSSRRGHRLWVAVHPPHRLREARGHPLRQLWKDHGPAAGLWKATGRSRRPTRPDRSDM
ncbi:hypothetical protein LP422_03670 [Janibacter limosus]|uniref:Uncharacterized protein n=1 Tax=Janibacter limosus TaxID=53458 RepID=A0AC61U670_9MICO|nr:hypothetical protein [Janibacter limosus]UUZ45327.1 hypothetical protein LP422_03670 [Janibacter limosus]